MTSSSGYLSPFTGPSPIIIPHYWTDPENMVETDWTDWLNEMILMVGSQWAWFQNRAPKSMVKNYRSISEVKSEGDERKKRRRIKGEKMHMPVGRNRGKAPIYYMPKYVESHREEGEGREGMRRRKKWWERATDALWPRRAKMMMRMGWETI